MGALLEAVTEEGTEPKVKSAAAGPVMVIAPVIFKVLTVPLFSKVIAVTFGVPTAEAT